MKKIKHASLKKVRGKKTLTINLKAYAGNLSTPLKPLERAAKKGMKDLKDHFTLKDGGWPLDYSFYVSDIFYQAFGHHLENYLLKAIVKSKLKVELVSKEGKLVINWNGLQFYEYLTGDLDLDRNQRHNNSTYMKCVLNKVTN